MSHLNRTTLKNQLLWAGLVFLAALLPRLYALGSFLTIDEVKWAEGAAQFIIALYSGDLARTYWHFFPGITITWGNAPALWGVCSTAPDLTGCINTQVEKLPQTIGWLRLSPVLLTSLGIVGCYLLSHRLLEPKVALLTALLLAFDPFFVAHSRILNGDAGAAILMFLALLAFLIYWLEQPLARRRWRFLLLSGGLAGLACLTKLPAPLIGFFIGGVGLVGLALDWPKAGGAAVGQWLAALVIWAGLALLLFVAIWPALWVAPLETLRQMYVDAFEVGGVGAGHDTFFLGQVSADPGAWFYPYVIAFRLTPIVMLGLIITAVWLLLPLTYFVLRTAYYLFRHTPLQPIDYLARFTLHASCFTLSVSRLTYPTSRAICVTLIMLVYVVFIILFANLSPKKLDRYVMAVIPPLILLAAFGLDYGLKLVAAAYKKYTAAERQPSAALMSTRSDSPPEKFSPELGDTGPVGWGIKKWVKNKGKIPPSPNPGPKWLGENFSSHLYYAVVVVLAAGQLLFAILAAPYYLTYYNPLLGGVKCIAARAPVGWGEGLEQAAAYLNGLPNAESLTVSSWYSDIFNPYFLGRRASFADDGRAQLAADYVVFYINQIQRQKPSPGLVDYFRAREPVFVVAVTPTGQTINSNGLAGIGDNVPWVEVYQAPAAQSAGGAPKIDGVAQLLAYKAAGNRSSTQAAEEQGAEGQETEGENSLAENEVAVTLYLRVLGPLPENASFAAGLVSNQRHGYWRTTETVGEWSPGNIVEWRGILTLPTGLPAGDYRLWTGLQASTLGHTETTPLAEFSISVNDPAIVIQP